MPELEETQKNSHDAALGRRRACLIRHEIVSSLPPLQARIAGRGSGRRPAGLRW
jgi:hypothetical protein